MMYYLVKQSMNRKIKVVSKSINRDMLQSLIDLLINCNYAMPTESNNTFSSNTSPSSYRLLSANELIDLATEYDFA